MVSSSNISPNGILVVSQCFAGVRKYVSLIVSIFIHTGLMAGYCVDVGRS